MKSACVFALLATLANSAFARPIVIEETTTLANPNPAAYEQFGYMVATNGEYALVGAQRDDLVDPSGEPISLRDALLYRRVAGVWRYQQVLRSVRQFEDSYYYPNVFAMKGDLAVIELDGSTQPYRLGTTGWAPVGGRRAVTEDIEIDGERFVLTTGDCTWSAHVFDPDGAGDWTRSGLSGQGRGCDDEFWGGPVDIEGNRVIIGNSYTEEDGDQYVPVYERAAGAWNRLATIYSPQGYRGFTGEVVLRGDDAIIDAYTGGYIYRLPDASKPVGRLRAADAFLQSRIDRYRDDTKMERSGDLVFVREPNYDRANYVINVFRANATSPGVYEHVAVLAPRNGATLGDWFDVNGNTVIAGGPQTAYIFELPASLTNRTSRLEDFESGNAANWTPGAGSQFSIVTSGTNHLYRQANSAGDARAILARTNWTNQAVEAEVTPRAFDGSDRWVGLITRYQNDENYRYVTLRSSGSVQLKRMRAGVITTIASSALPVTVNRRYKLRLESIGSMHRVYVDGALVLDADDAGIPRYGNAGLMTSRARADFDNVVVTPSPLTTVYVDDFAVTSGDEWMHSGSGQWAFTAGAFTQNTFGAQARAVIGGSTADQVVEARVRQTAWSTTGTAERWAGVLARYVDEGNYYYLHLRSGGTVSLRKLVNGTVVTLASAPLAVTLNTQYALRLEVVGDKLRGYVNGNLLLQATDTSHAEGLSGLMTSKAKTQFDDYVAYQP